MEWSEELESNEYTKIIAEALEKIKAKAKDNLKTELEEALAWKHKYDALTIACVNREEEIEKLQKENAELQEKLVAKQGHKYNIGDIVYIVDSEKDKTKLLCPTCGGTGTVKATTIDPDFPLKDADIGCPVCHGRLSSYYNEPKDKVYNNSYRTTYEYSLKRVTKVKICGIETSETNGYVYKVQKIISNLYDWIDELFIYKTAEGAQATADYCNRTVDQTIAKYIGPKWESEAIKEKGEKD